MYVCCIPLPTLCPRWLCFLVEDALGWRYIAADEPVPRATSVY